MIEKKKIVRGSRNSYMKQVKRIKPLRKLKKDLNNSAEWIIKIVN